MMKEAELILRNQAEFLQYLRKKFSLFHRSNLFFRDLQYGVMSYLGDHGTRRGYPAAEAITKDVAAGFEKNGIMRRIDHQSWLLNYPNFALPQAGKTEARPASA